MDLVPYSEHYHKCDDCGTLVSNLEFTNSIYQIKDEEKDLYGKNYWQDKMLKLSGKKNIDELIDYYISDRCIYWLQFLLKYVEPGRSVIEIGCGLGQFPYILKNAGYNQIAFELSREICDLVKEKLDIKIVNSNIGKYKHKSDCIIMMDLLEHIENPITFFEDINHHIKDNGILCIQTPCYDSNLTYDKMMSLKPEFKFLMQEKEHIYLYSKKSIVKLLNKNGFSYVSFENAYFGDNYDMFIFASKKPIKTRNNEEIENNLNSLQNGRIIKALIKLFNEKLNMQKEINEINLDRNKRLEIINKLTNEINLIEIDRKNRLELIEDLSNKLQLSEDDRAQRLNVINSLSSQNKEKECELSNKNQIIREQQLIIDKFKKEMQNIKVDELL